MSFDKELQAMYEGCGNRMFTEKQLGDATATFSQLEERVRRGLVVTVLMAPAYFVWVEGVVGDRLIARDQYGKECFLLRAADDGIALAYPKREVLRTCLNH